MPRARGPGHTTRRSPQAFLILFAFATPAFIKAAITLTLSPENKLTISRGRIVTRYNRGRGRVGEIPEPNRHGAAFVPGGFRRGGYGHHREAGPAYAERSRSC